LPIRSLLLDTTLVQGSLSKAGHFLAHASDCLA